MPDIFYMQGFFLCSVNVAPCGVFDVDYKTVRIFPGGDFIVGFFGKIYYKSAGVLLIRRSEAACSVNSVGFC